MLGWPNEADLYKSFVDEVVADPMVMWQRAELLSLKPSALIVDMLASDIVEGAHDILDPRQRNGPWRPGWRPFS